jgi:hypothetical protein
MSETPYAETEVLLLIMRGELDQARSVLADFTKVELDEIDNFVHDLLSLVHQETRNRQVQEVLEAEPLRIVK